GHRHGATPRHQERCTAGTNRCRPPHWRLPLLPAYAPRVARQPGVLGSEGLMRAARASSFTLLTGPRRLVRRNELVPAVADEISAPHAAQRLAQQRPV